MGEHLYLDLKHGLRTLRKEPGFTAVAVLSLALGIGANTTMFTFVNAVLLRPLPYPAADRIIVLRERKLTGQGTVSVHPANYLEWRARAGAFESLALLQTPPLNVMGRDGAEQIVRVQTTPQLFRVFGVAPVLGRAFTDEDAASGGRPVVILGHGFWQRWFGGDPSVLGRTLTLPNRALTIVGVAPAGFRIGLVEPDAYTPLGIDPARPDSIGSRSFECYGRLAPGATLVSAKAEMDAIASVLARELPLDRGYGVFVAPLQEYLTRDVRGALALLMGVVAMVLLIACTNLGGLLLARGLNRRGELAVRVSLGATRARLVAGLVTESLLIALLGGASGFALAWWATDALGRLTTNAITLGTRQPVTPDVASLTFTAIVSVITALVCGLLPAWQGSRFVPQDAFRRQARGATADRQQHRLRTVLVVAEVALAVVLVVAASLLLRTFTHLTRVDLGFEPSETVTMRLFLGTGPAEMRIALLDRILHRVDTLPGVTAAGTIQFLPLSGANCGTGFRRDGEPTGDPSNQLATDCSLVSSGYFRAMRIPLVAGRTFDANDRRDTPRVLVVNQAFVRRYFPDGPAIGRRVQLEWETRIRPEIVGVVGDVRHNGLTSEPAPTVFILHAQEPGYITNLVVRTNQDPVNQAAAIRRAIQEVDRTQAVSSVRTLEDYLDAALARPRLNAALVVCFAGLAAGLALLGIYGLIAYVVHQRTHEIGIRLALGATARAVFLGVLGQGARLVAAGLLVGLALAAALRGAIASFLAGVTAGDATSYLAAAIAMCTMAVVVVAIPARRAARTEPAAALRAE
jgi:putative ABC transport system permease protein